MLAVVTALVLLGLGSRGLAAANAVAVVAAVAVAFVFLPAVDEMEDRADRAVTNLVLTATAG